MRYQFLVQKIELSSYFDACHIGTVSCPFRLQLLETSKDEHGTVCSRGYLHLMSLQLPEIGRDGGLVSEMGFLHFDLLGTENGCRYGYRKILKGKKIEEKQHDFIQFYNLTVYFFKLSKRSNDLYLNNMSHEDNQVAVLD